jgi:hypothetical protein
MRQTYSTGVVAVLAFLSLSCLNPFAPGLDAEPGRGICPDLTTIEGLFCTFQNAYSFRDTTLYGSLIAPDFAFVFRDYENSVDVTWGRDQEMRSTYGLFQNVQVLLLTWNNIISEYSSGDTAYSVVRSFNLTVTFNPSDVERVDGYANFQLRREGGSEPWKIIRWRDESNF